MAFTVVVRNGMLGTTRAVGTFETQEKAEAYALSESRRSRSFVVFEVWTGTPRNPGRPVGYCQKGQC